MPLKLRHLAGLALAVSLLPAAPAEAGTASGAYIPGGWAEVISYNASPGEQNSLTVRVTVENGIVTSAEFRDTGAPVTAGAYCTSLDAHSAVCALPPDAVPNVSAYLEDGDDEATLVAGFAEVYGGPGEDRLRSIGDAYFFRAFGDGGDDLIVAEGSSPTAAYEVEGEFEGGEGDDTLAGSVHNEHLYGGPGHDRVDGGGGDDQISGNEGDDKLDGGGGNDQISGQDGDDAIRGGAGDDDAWGGDGVDRLLGGPGDDWMSGGWGDDLLDPGSGSDIVWGDHGDDRIDVRDGWRDQFSCDEGNDRLAADPLDDEDQVLLSDPFDEETSCEEITRCGLEAGGEPPRGARGCAHAAARAAAEL